MGTILYYALAMYSTILVPLSNLASTQAKDTEQTYNGVVWILKYTASHPEDIVRYNQSNTILQVHRSVS